MALAIINLKYAGTLRENFHRKVSFQLETSNLPSRKNLAVPYRFIVKICDTNCINFVLVMFGFHYKNYNITVMYKNDPN